MNKGKTLSRALPLVFAAIGLAGCGSIGYRCPLEPGKKADSPTACASMHDAMEGAKQGRGSKTSVLLDERGRLIPSGLVQQGRPDWPAAVDGEPYRHPAGAPVFEQPKVFQAWVPAFVDADGNLHDGHHSWFSTPGRWSYGSTRKAGTAGDFMLRPAMPDSRPRAVVKSAADLAPQVQQTAPQQQAQPQQAQPAPAQSQQERDKAALNTLAKAAQSAAQPKPKAAPTSTSTANVTAPAVNLGE